MLTRVMCRYYRETFQPCNYHTNSQIFITLKTLNLKHNSLKGSLSNKLIQRKQANQEQKIQIPIGDASASSMQDPRGFLLVVL